MRSLTEPVFIAKKSLIRGSNCDLYFSSINKELFNCHLMFWWTALSLQWAFTAGWSDNILGYMLTDSKYISIFWVKKYDLSLNKICVVLRCIVPKHRVGDMPAIYSVMLLEKATHNFWKVEFVFLDLSNTAAQIALNSPQNMTYGVSINDIYFAQ